MKLHSQKAKRVVRLQRIGRSGKRGSYSGRGVKGQRSRSGHRIRPAERDIILKIPKKRGFRNKPKREAPVIINLTTIAKKFASHAKGGAVEINRDVLRTAGLLKKDYKGFVKVLGTGEITFAVSVKGFQVSGSAKEKIVKAGGSVQ